MPKPRPGPQRRPLAAAAASTRTESVNSLFVVPLVLLGLLGLVAAAVPAVAMMRRSRSAPAAATFTATSEEPSNAAEWQARADALFQRADLAGALDAVQTSIELLEPTALETDAAEAPRLALSHAHLLQGRVLERLPPTRCAGGTCTEHAANAYRRALIRAPGGAAQLPEAERALRRVSGALDGASAPYVAALFDEYAGSFDAALSRLDYRAPALVAAAVRDVIGERVQQQQQQQQPASLRSVLDAGCGTGLVGVELRPLATRLEGVDLSGGMLAQARARAGVYDALHQVELVEFLQRSKVRRTAYAVRCTSTSVQHQHRCRADGSADSPLTRSRALSLSLSLSLALALSLSLPLSRTHEPVTTDCVSPPNTAAHSAGWRHPSPPPACAGRSRLRRHRRCGRLQLPRRRRAARRHRCRRRSAERRWRFAGVHSGGLAGRPRGLARRRWRGSGGGGGEGGW